MANLAALITKVKYNIGGRTDKDTAITDALNQAVEDIANFADWQNLLTHSSTVSLAYGNYMAAKPSDYRKIIEVRLSDTDNNYYDIEICGRSRFRELVPEFIPGDYGLPSYCYLENGIYYFDYLADKTYTVRYDGYKYPTAMSGTSDTPSITGFDDIIVAQATGYIFASIKQTDMSAFWFAIAEAKLRDKLDETRISEVGQLEPW